MAPTDAVGKRAPPPTSSGSLLLVTFLYVRSWVLPEEFVLVVGVSVSSNTHNMKIDHTFGF